MLADRNNSSGVPYFRAWDSNWRLRNHPLKRAAIPSNFRGDIYTSVGIRPSEINAQLLGANLSDFRALIVKKGLFRIALTNDPTLHLRFVHNETRPTLFVLDSRTISMLALLDLTGFML